MREDLLYLVWLSSVTPTGSPLAHSLLRYFGSARAVWEAGRDDLLSAPVDWQGREAPLFDKSLAFAEQVLSYCEKNGVAITTVLDPFYPNRLRQLASPPLLFYHVGAFCDLDRTPSVSVVGARTPSAYGERAAKRLCVDLARGGATLISGLARGIDGLSHRAALWCQTFTVGVLGCGIDRIYPPEHRDLICQVAESGLLLTEYAPGTPPAARNFPMRNRLIAALSPVTLVVEASVSSGSLITAEHALRLARELFAVPSPIFSATGAGANHLLLCGAKPALRAEDILSVLEATFPEKIRRDGGAKSTRRPGRASTAFAGSAASARTLAEFTHPAPPRAENGKRTFEKCSILELDEKERALLCRLTHEPVSAEALADESLSAAALSRLLSSLEIKGYAERKSGGRFCLSDDS